MKTLEQRRRDQARHEATRADRPHGGEKRRKPLTGKQQGLAEQAYAYGLLVSKRFNEKYARFSLDFDGAVAERLVKSISRYDPKKSHIKTWTYRHAAGACLDLLRTNVMVGRHVRGDTANRNPRVCSIENIRHRMDLATQYEPNDAPPGFLARWDAPTPLESADAVAHILRGLNGRERDVISLYYISGLSMREIGIRIGLCESRVSQMHTAILERLRARRESA